MDNELIELEKKIVELERELDRLVYLAKEEALSANALEVARLYGEVVKCAEELRAVYLEMDF